MLHEMEKRVCQIKNSCINYKKNIDDMSIIITNNYSLEEEYKFEESVLCLHLWK